MIAFSTCWNAARHATGDAMLREIQKLGFDLIELGHGIRASLVPGIQEMFDAGQARFSSVHNFCPSFADATLRWPDCCEFSAAAAEERERAVKQTRQTIDFAQRLAAPLVILHLGRVPMRPVINQLITMAKAGGYLSRRYVRAKLDGVRRRERLAPVYLERVRDCLRRIIDYAAAKSIRLAIEGTRGYEEIPTERELLALLNELDSRNLGYWHNFGHAQLKENLAFIDHGEWLREIGWRTLGCHVQDCAWPASDRELPFTGGVDFEKLVPLLPAGCLFVWKMSPNRSAAEICRSVQAWKGRFGE